MENLEEYLNTITVSINNYEFIINLFITALLSKILAFIYVKFGNSLSNRRNFSRIFVLISMTTMLVITIVKSSLALSLGLVGALSIVRFRAAIKEPEELGFVFLAISIGLGLGANQPTVTIIAITCIFVVIFLTKKLSKDVYKEQNLHLIISSNKSNPNNSKQIIEILNKSCRSIDLQRLDEKNDNIELSFLVEIDSIKEINDLKNELRVFDKKINITFLDNKGIL